jgi:guanine deaminase
MTIYQGTFIDTPTPQTFRVRENHFVLVEHGKVQAVAETLPAEYQNHPVVDWNQGFLIPSFTDLHVHAPQHMQMGAGLDLGLLDWLNQYTFPRESRFADQAYAQELYPYFAQDLLRSGSLRSVIYGTIHQESTQILAQELEKRGLMALVGKVNMDQTPRTPLGKPLRTPCKPPGISAGRSGATRTSKPSSPPALPPPARRSS